ncbi:uncharacterized protein H6S33_000355 [Morchella sextelata]|uniref:uncharacterized protein n=1 Tax=Morchella sextelata TaxID=1174677 RepID=UPI001D0408B7|nr:uncharacterized protein H6S33_000355 [Morchella sextelata]KAH0614719.1 hypothetical protein H6S33_000355 [Morchella sextelata]
MAELFGLVVNIATAIDLAGKLANLGYDYIDGAMNASNHTERLVEELNSLVHVLQSLQTGFKFRTRSRASIQRNRKACEGNRKDAKDTKDLVRVQTAALDSFMSKMESDQLTKQRNEILQWLYPEDPRLKHIEISGQRHAGTGEWLFEKPEFKNWIKE